MDPDYRLISSTDEFRVFQEQLQASDLPWRDLRFDRDLLVGYYEGDSLVGTGCLEIYGTEALLRSLSVRLGIRGKSIGTGITQFLLQHARNKNIRSVYLLTETARDFFLKKGFLEINRSNVPESIKSSSEFSNVCPASAIVMKLDLS